MSEAESVTVHIEANLAAFREAMARVVVAYEQNRLAVERWLYEMDAPKRSAMHAAYHRKTARRNRRRR